MSTEKKFLGENGLLYVWQKIKTLLGTKVDKVDGKNLSTNDYTTDEKNKLADIEAGAQVNVIESITINGATATIDDKAATLTIEAGKIDEISVNGDVRPIINKSVNITVPEKVSDLTIDGDVVVDDEYVHTDNNYTTEEKEKLADLKKIIKTSELINDSDFQTSEEVQDAIEEAIGDITSFDTKILKEGEYDETTKKPTITGQKGIIYFTPKTPTETNNIYIEWIYTGSDFDKIGDTAIDLSEYEKAEDIQELSNAEIDAIIKKV